MSPTDPKDIAEMHTVPYMQAVGALMYHCGMRKSWILMKASSNTHFNVIIFATPLTHVRINITVGNI